MRIAYLILAHNTPNHLPRLVRALDSPNAAFFIHVDRKSDISLFRNRLSQPNVTFLDDRVPVYWGDFSDVKATVKLIKHALSVSPPSHYLVLLSGSDYPLRSSQYIEAFFSQNQGREFINLVPMPCEAVGKRLERLQIYWLQTPCNKKFVIRAVARMNRLNTSRLWLKRDYSKVLKGIAPYGGSQWWALTREVSQYVLSFVESRPAVVKFFRNVYMPDESFFQTIIGNSKFAQHVSRNLTFTDWSKPHGGPAPIDMDHLRNFMSNGLIVRDGVYGTGELLFARKFSDDSALLTNFIDAQLVNRSWFTQLA